MTAQKIMLLGDIGVGKSSLARRLVLGRFDHDYKATIGVDIYSHALSLEGHGRVDLSIWDIDGDLGDSIFNHIYIRGATGALIIGDRTRVTTQETMASLSRGFRDSMAGRPFELLLNKIDLVEDAGSAPPPALAALRERVILASAKTGANVTEAFRSLAAAAIMRGLC